MDDCYIQLFCQSMRSDEIGVPGFPEITTTKEELLCEALTMIIYTASYQHSAVNYFQDEFMGYVPNAPSFLAEAPASLTALNEEDLMRALPTPRTADLATATLEMLSVRPVPQHRLSELKAEDSNNYHLPWEKAAQKLKIMQRDLKADLNGLQNAVTNETLAQSVLI